MCSILLCTLLNPKSYCFDLARVQRRLLDWHQQARTPHRFSRLDKLDVQVTVVRRTWINEQKRALLRGAWLRTLESDRLANINVLALACGCVVFL